MILSGKGTMSRRQLLAAGGAAGVSLIVGSMPAFGQETPRRGGVLKVALSGAIDTPDPHKTLSYAGQHIGACLYEGLTALDANDQPVPALATSWAAENGAQEWVFELRQGVKFHHGREFTSADVVASIERVQDKAGGFPARGAYGPVEKVVAEGPYRVRLVLTQPCAELPVLQANRQARMLAADKLATMDTDPVGTGPFIFKELEPGVGTYVVRNPNYWQPDKPYLDGVRLVQISQSIAQQAALRAGSVDIVEQMTSDAVLTLKSVPGVKVFSQPTANYVCALMLANMEPFENPLVRQAFKYVVDRDALLASSLLGQGIVANDTTVLPSSPYYPADLPQNNQDLKKARALLDQAGIGQMTLDMYTSSERQPGPKIGVAFKEAASKIGVTINLHDVPHSEMLSSVSKKKPFYTSAWIDRVSLYESLYQINHSTAALNFSGKELYPGLDAKLEDLISELDFDQRKKKTGECLAIISQYSDRLIPMFSNTMCASSEKVVNFKPGVHGAPDLRNVWISS